MRGFQTLNVTYAKNVTETGGDFQTFKFETWDADITEMLDSMSDNGWERVSVVVEASEFEAEINKHISSTDDILNVLETLENAAWQAGYVVAFLMRNDVADVTNWTDRIYMSGSDAEALVREWADTFHKVYQPHIRHYYDVEYKEIDPFPSWMVLDWDKTLDKIANDNHNSVVEFNGELYMFSND